MSEPCHTITDRKSPPPRPASVTLSPLKGSVSPTELHPNQAVILDEVGEEEMVENKLVIPDEMVQYLSQVVDTQNDFGNLQWSQSQTNTTTTQKPVSSPSANNINQILPSPSSTYNHILSSPQTIMHSVMSPASHQIMSPAGNMNQMIPSPSSNINQMMPSPSTNINRIMPSPAPHYNQMQSPTTNFNNIPNPMMSPAPSINQSVMSPSTNHMVPSPAGSNTNQMIQPNLPMHCHSQLGPPGMSNINRGHQLMLSASIPLQSPNPHMIQAAQNCTGPISNQQINMQQSNQMMQSINVANGCYNRPPNHNVCYVQPGSNWEVNPNQNRMCPASNQISQPSGHNMCVDYNNQCRTQMQMSNSYMGPTISTTPGNQCGNHNFQICSQSYVGNCHSKQSNYNCTNNYTSMQSPGYTCGPNMNEPLSSPAMATPAPTEMVNQPQQAQMTRPCLHYEQNCYRYNNPCTNTINRQQCTNCNCQKAYPQNQKCYHNCSTQEIQCKDISQSQMSPSIGNPNNAQTPSNTQPFGMRQDTYQRTLEYVQNCQSWVSNTDCVSSSTHPLAKCTETSNPNMVVNDMTSSLSSLLEENRYLQMIQ